MTIQEEEDHDAVNCLIELLPLAARWGVFAPEGEETFREAYWIVSEQMDRKMEEAGYEIHCGESEWDEDFEPEEEEEEENEKEEEEEGEEEIAGGGRRSCNVCKRRRRRVRRKQLNEIGN